MKKIILLLLCLTFFSVNAQKITKKFLVGKWTSESTEMVFSIENKKDFKNCLLFYFEWELFKGYGLSV